MNKDSYYKSLESTEKSFIEWCNEEGIPIHGIQCVATFEEWDDGISVAVFLNKFNDVSKITESEINRIFNKYKQLLKQHDYPFKKFPNVRYELDSHQNVMENYDGSYFNRSR